MLSVGTQFPFDRLVKAVDDWAGRSGRRDVVGQIGHAEFRPQHIEAHDYIAPAQFQRLQTDAHFLIAHAGMGSILTALDAGKPIVVMPRDHRLGEHRNAHQFATVQRMRHVPGVHVAMDEDELGALLERIDELKGAAAGSAGPVPELVAFVRSFIER